MRWLTLASLCLTACDEDGHPTTTTPTAERTCPESAILALLNDEDTTSETLQDLGLRSPAIHHILTTRAGDDGVFGTDDDQPFTSLEDVDDVPYVGPVSMELLWDWGEDWCEDEDSGIDPKIIETV